MILTYYDLEIVPLHQFTDTLSRQHILRAIEICGTRKAAAERLKISLACLYRILANTAPPPEPVPVSVPVTIKQPEPDIPPPPRPKPVRPTKPSKPPKPIIIPRHDCRIEMLLGLFRVTPRCGFRNFWHLHSTTELEWFLRDARDSYRRLAYAMHPDVNHDPQSHRRMADLNRAWDRLCYLFKAHGVQA